MYVTPKEAVKYYSVTDNTLRIWANNRKIKYITTKGGHRRYLLEPKNKIEIIKKNLEETQQNKVIYARVSSRKQENDLQRQKEYLKGKYPDHYIITDIGSGINFERPGFKRILEGVFKGNIKEVMVAHRDRFTRFGYNLFEWIFSLYGSKIICDNRQERNQQEELSEDLMAIITVFTARYHGRRKYKTNKLL